MGWWSDLRDDVIKPVVGAYIGYQTGGWGGALLGGAVGASAGSAGQTPEAATSTTTATSEPPAWALPILQNYSSLLQNYMQPTTTTLPDGTVVPVNRPPLPFYPGQTFADFTPAQLQGQELALQAAGNIQSMVPNYLSTIQSTQPVFEQMLAGQANPYAGALNQFGAGNNPYSELLTQYSSPTTNPWASALAPYTGNAANPYADILAPMMNVGMNPYAGIVGEIGANAAYNPYSGVIGQFAGGTTNPYAANLEQLMTPTVSPFAYTPTMQAMLAGEINPYATQMGNTIAGQLGTQFSENVLPYIRNEAMSAGTYGGSRQALSEGMAAGRFGEALAGQLGNLYGSMWESAQSRALQAGLGLGNLYETAQGRALQAVTQGANLYETSADRALRAATEGAGLYQQGQQLALSAALGGGQMYSTEANRALQAVLGGGEMYQASTDAAIRALLGGGQLYESAQDRAVRAASEAAGLYETEMDRALRATIEGGQLYESAQDRALKAAVGLTTTYPAALSSAMEAMTVPSTIYAQVGAEQQAMQQQAINDAMARYYYDPQLAQLQTLSGLLPGGYATQHSTTTVPTYEPGLSQQLLAAGLTGYGVSKMTGNTGYGWLAGLLGLGVLD